MSKSAALLGLERTWICRDVDSVPLECFKLDDRQHRLVRRGQDNRCGYPVVEGSCPVHGGHAPAVARNQPWEAVLGQRRGQVVADTALMVEELGRDDGTDGVATQVLGSGAAAAVAEESGQRLGATGLELVAKHVAFGHEPSIAY